MNPKNPKTPEILCPRCKEKNTIIKHGFRLVNSEKVQILKCKACEHYFEKTKLGTTNEEIKKEKILKTMESLRLFKMGISMRRIGKYLNVSGNTISLWVKPHLTMEDKKEHAINALEMTKEKEEKILQK